MLPVCMKMESLNRGMIWFILNVKSITLVAVLRLSEDKSGNQLGGYHSNSSDKWQ